MRPKVIAENGEFLFIVVCDNGVYCATRYNKKYGAYVDVAPCYCYDEAVMQCKKGVRGKWFD